jgi:hypothetical protein
MKATINHKIIELFRQKMHVARAKKSTMMMLFLPKKTILWLLLHHLMIIRYCFGGLLHLNVSGALEVMDIFHSWHQHHGSWCMKKHCREGTSFYHHEWSPPVLPSHCHTHAPASHCLPLVSPEHSDDGEEEKRALDNSNHLSQEPHYIHGDTMDASPGLCLDNAHDSEDDVSKEFYEEQDEKKNVVSYAVLLRKPYEPGYTATPDCGHLCRTSCRL